MAAQATIPGTSRERLHTLLADRWSPRAFDRAHELGDAEVEALLEAARWSPSAANSQPWRFAVVRRGTPEHAAVLDTLLPGNRAWADAASALVVAAAETVGPDGRPRTWAAYDTGQAVAHLTLQALHEGLAVRQMGGFDRDRLARLLDVGDSVTPLVVLAVGRTEPATAGVARDRLPVEALRVGVSAPAPVPAAA
jgi:nitroreductase